MPKIRSQEDEKQKPEPGMYLSSLSLQRFRSCYETTIKLQPGLTLIVGENNAGKSNVIDAIRLATSPLSNRRSRYFEPADASRSPERSPAELSLTFDGLTENQRGQYMTALDLESNTITYGVRYAPEAPGERRALPTYTAGTVPGPDAEPEKRDQIAHVYLTPLRDAQRELQSGNGRRLEQIMSLLTEEEDRQLFADSAKLALDSLESQPAVTKTVEGVQRHMTQLTTPVRGQEVGIGFDKDEIGFITRNLRMRLAESGVVPSDLAGSGLGYANLLFIATVILELQAARDAELTLFLVEEPEAHLHPQLQAVLLDFLRGEAEASYEHDDSSGPAGRIQVIATTHSPNLASGIGISNVVMLRSASLTITATDESPEIVHTNTIAIPLCDLPLEKRDARKIDQYLDATRASLLFGRRVLLVEGVAEAVLLPAFARQRVLKGNGDALRDFRGVTLINVGSVDFKPYIKLLLGTVNGCRLLDQLVIITDGDPSVKPLEEGDTPYNRADELRTLARQLGAEDCLYVAESSYTLEADLLRPAENEPVLRAAYLAQHPRSEGKWEVIAEDESPAAALYLELHENEKFISKGEFAHDIALALQEEDTVFTVPEYITDAIRSVLGLRGEVDGDDQDDAQ